MTRRSPGTVRPHRTSEDRLEIDAQPQPGESPAAPPSALRAPGHPRTRIESLCDPGSFLERGSARRHRATAFGLDARRPAGDGVVVGNGMVDRRPVAVYAQDRTTLGGSLGEAHADKIARCVDAATRTGVPVLGINDSGGARIQEGVGALDGYGSVFRANVAASGRVPQIALILGPCAGGAVYSPALMDFVIMRSDAYMFLTGPKVVKAVTNEDVDERSLGGAAVHTETSGCAHFVVDTDEEALALARALLSYLPSSSWQPQTERPRRLEMGEPAGTLPSDVVPTDESKPYDVRDLVRALIDGTAFLEIHEHWARNIVVGFARLDGHSVGIVANQPAWMAGCLDADASDKGARFVRFCDAFGIPIVTLADVPGFLPGSVQERSGVIRRGAKLLHAFASSSVPRTTVVLRKAYGGAYIVMNSRSLGATSVFAWPNAELAVMGADGAVDIVFRRDLEANPDARQELLDRYRRDAMRVDLAAARGSVDEVIDPDATRTHLLDFVRNAAMTQTRGFVRDNLPQ